jgi:hypothetical protein
MIVYLGKDKVCSVLEAINRIFFYISCHVFNVVSTRLAIVVWRQWHRYYWTMELQLICQEETTKHHCMMPCTMDVLTVFGYWCHMVLHSQLGNCPM